MAAAIRQAAIGDGEGSNLNYVSSHVAGASPRTTLLMGGMFGPTVPVSTGRRRSATRAAIASRKRRRGWRRRAPSVLPRIRKWTRCWTRTVTRSHGAQSGARIALLRSPTRAMTRMATSGLGIRRHRSSVRHGASCASGGRGQFARRALRRAVPCVLMCLRSGMMRVL